jgi:hypothetical protein
MAPSLAEQDRALDRVLQLPDAAGPRVPLQPAEGLAGEPRAASRASRAHHFSMKCSASCAISPRRSAERRDDDRGACEPVIEIAAVNVPRATRSPDHGWSRDEAHVDRAWPHRPDAHDLSLLEHPQELRLERRRHLAGLVEKERSRRRRALDEADLLPVGR